MNNAPKLPIWYMVVRNEPVVNGRFYLWRVLACQSTTLDQMEDMYSKYRALIESSHNTQAMYFYRVEDGLFTDFLKFFVEVMGERRA